MEVSPIRHVAKARKQHSCSWCATAIKPGQPYCRWFTYGENVTSRLHPECYRAMCRADLYDEEMPDPGTYRRGCWCGEDEAHCQCTQEKAHEQVPTADY